MLPVMCAGILTGVSCEQIFECSLPAFAVKRYDHGLQRKRMVQLKEYSWITAGKKEKLREQHMVTME